MGIVGDMIYHRRRSPSIEFEARGRWTPINRSPPAPFRANGDGMITRRAVGAMFFIRCLPNSWTNDRPIVVAMKARSYWPSSKGVAGDRVGGDTPDRASDTDGAVQPLITGQGLDAVAAVALQ